MYHEQYIMSNVSWAIYHQQCICHLYQCNCINVSCAMYHEQCIWAEVLLPQKLFLHHRLLGLESPKTFDQIKEPHGCAKKANLVLIFKRPNLYNQMNPLLVTIGPQLLGNIWNWLKKHCSQPRKKSFSSQRGWALGKVVSIRGQNKKHRKNCETGLVTITAAKQQLQQN